MRESGEFEMTPIGGLLTHERKVDVQAAFIVNEGGITDTVRLNPITYVLAKLMMTRLGAI
jgi:hypothetical protein